MSLSLRFLGTAASRPTVERNVSSTAIVREGETILVDCGEGTQRQMMRYGISFNLGDILFTHYHADHVLGVVGLLRTLQLQGRTDPIRLHGPVGLGRLVRLAEQFGGERWGFAVETNELEPGASIKRPGYEIVSFPVDHRGARAFGYALVEENRLGRFNPDTARALGIPEGPLWGKLHRGQTVTLDDGRVIDGAKLVGPTRPGRRIVITGDTRPADATIIAAPSSTKDANATRDPEMKQTRKGRNWHFGMKLHLGADKRGIVHTVRATAASVADITQLPELLHGQEREVFGDQAYWKEDDREFLEAWGMRYRINRRATSKRPLGARWRMINRARSRTRARGEHAFRVVKQLWGFAKVRYRGLAKNLARAQTMFALANLYQLRRELLPAR